MAWIEEGRSRATINASLMKRLETWRRSSNDRRNRGRYDVRRGLL
jgi:hypothetical protein